MINNAMQTYLTCTRIYPFVDQIKAFVAFMLNPVAKGNMH
jgi:hypothetical protein